MISPLSCTYVNRDFSVAPVRRHEIMKRFSSTWGASSQSVVKISFLQVKLSGKRTFHQSSCLSLSWLAGVCGKSIESVQCRDRSEGGRGGRERERERERERQDSMIDSESESVPPYKYHLT